MKNYVCLLAVYTILFSLPALARAGTSAQNQDNRITARVDLLQLGVVVVGKDGKLVTNLASENFRITICPSAPADKVAKGKKRKAARNGGCITLDRPDIFDKENLPPLRVEGGIDTSGSTTLYLDKLSKPAVVKLLRTLIADNQNGLSVGKEDRYSLWKFSETYEKITPWTRDIGLAENSLTPLRSGGLSAVFEAIYLCSENMRSVGNFTKFCVLVTDGLDTIRQRKLIGEDGRQCEEQILWGRPTTCRPVKTDDLAYSLLDTQTTLYVVDFSKRYDKKDLQSAFRPPLNEPEELGDIARASGGERILVKNVEEAERAFEEIANMIKQRYVLGSYVKINPNFSCYDTYVEIGAWRNGKFEVNDDYTENAAYRKRWCVQ